MSILFLGGDIRQKYASDYLTANKFYNKIYNEFALDEEIVNEIRNSKAIILPLPVSRDNININMSSAAKVSLMDIIEIKPSRALLFGGNFSKELINKLESLEIEYIDYYRAESFQIKNALLSAEGAIYYAKERLDKSIYGSNVAILGFGRIGKILSYLLKVQGANVTICARKDSDITWSKLIGFNIVSIKDPTNIEKMEKYEMEFDIIFNTVPYWIMDEKFASVISNKTLILDLASMPFGIDESLVKKYKLNYYKELGIPGRYAPRSAGELIGRTIINNLIKEG